MLLQHMWAAARSTPLEAASPHVLHGRSVGRRIGRALTSTLRDAATSHGESERSGNGGVEKARIDVLPPDEAMPPFSEVASATIMSASRSDGCVERALRRGFRNGMGSWGG